MLLFLVKFQLLWCQEELRTSATLVLDLTSMFTVIVSNIFLPRLCLKVRAEAALAIVVFPSRCHVLFERPNPGESPSTCDTQIPDNISTMNSPISYK